MALPLSSDLNLFTADESDDDRDDRRLATHANMPRVKEKHAADGGRKRASAAGGKSKSTANDVFKLQGNKLFGSFDLKKMVGEDEVAFHN